jgi:hypothetical protein
MSAQKPPAHGQFDDNEAERSEPDAEELRLLEERLAELRAEGVLSGDAGPRKPLKPVAHIPGALARFLAERG